VAPSETNPSGTLGRTLPDLQPGVASTADLEVLVMAQRHHFLLSFFSFLLFFLLCDLSWSFGVGGFSGESCDSGFGLGATFQGSITTI
jgi:hypothetical protein